MEKLQIKGKWNDVKRRFKTAYPDLKDVDLEYDEANEERFLSRLQQKTGKDLEELVRQLNQFTKAM